MFGTHRIREKIETLANVATILVAILIAVVLVRQSVSNHNSKEPPSLIGKRLSIAGKPFKPEKTTLVLVLSTNCRFCTESAPFYRRLIDRTEGKRKFELVGVFPQGLESVHNYLQGLGLNIPEVYQATMNSLGLTSTPTIVVVDGRGVVTHMWVGQLPPDREREVLELFL